MAGTLLLVEDEPSVGELVRGYLGRDGYRVLWVRSGEEALGELERHPVRLVILDVGLPGMDGFEVARRLRADPRHAGMFLIALTGYGQATDRAYGRQAGFDEHLVKPVNVDEILSLLCALKGHKGDEVETESPRRVPSSSGASRAAGSTTATE